VRTSVRWEQRESQTTLMSSKYILFFPDCKRGKKKGKRTISKISPLYITVFQEGKEKEEKEKMRASNREGGGKHSSLLFHVRCFDKKEEREGKKRGSS